MKVSFVVTVLALAIISSLSNAQKTKFRPITDEFIQEINSKQSTWKAGKNFNVIPNLNTLLGVKPKALSPVKLPVKTFKSGKTDIPEEFDAREAWPECADVIGHIRDQSACGSCWAIAATEAMSDRICIHSGAKQKISVSTTDLMSCCFDCGDGCQGGWLGPAWSYWESDGIVSGGDYNSHEGCKAYPFPQCEHHAEGQLAPCGELQETPQCTKSCDSNSGASYNKSLTFGSAYIMRNNVADIQREIMTNGPVECSFDVYEDFLTYKSGVYQHVSGEYAGGHAMKIIGWGVDEGTPYWLIANSWNPDWGQNGYIKFLRGENHLEIEADINAGIPKL